MAAAMDISVSSLTHVDSSLARESPQDTHFKIRLERVCNRLLMGEVFKERNGLPLAQFYKRRKISG